MKYLLDIKVKSFQHRVIIHILTGTILLIGVWILVNMLNFNKNLFDYFNGLVVMFVCMCIIVLLRDLSVGKDKIYRIAKEDNLVTISWMHFNKKMEVKVDKKNLKIEIEPILRTDTIFAFYINNENKQITIRDNGSRNFGSKRLKEIKEEIFS